jgi:hypothetical protein
MFSRQLRSVLLLPAALLMSASALVHADEGIRTFDNPPLKLLKAE